MQRIDLIIWDEVSITHQHACDALFRTLKNILLLVDQDVEENIFGGLTIALGGDFSIILPVVYKGSRE